jgi:2,3-bisphosphoglycerate-dependent phosphoglycerate mutase
MLTVLLVRHAEPVLPGTPGFDEFSRPLTESGARDANALAKAFGYLEPDAVYSSPMRRAMQTVEGFAVSRGLEVIPMHNFHEHVLAPEPIPNWREMLEQSWQDFDFALPGAQTMRETQDRGFYALRLLADHHSSGTIVIGGHGTIFSLILNKIEPRVDCVFHLSMPMPAVHTLEFDGGIWEIVSGAGF